MAGFSNGPEFDDWIRQGWLNVDASPNDVLNLRKLENEYFQRLEHTAAAP